MIHFESLEIFSKSCAPFSDNYTTVCKIEKNIPMLDPEKSCLQANIHTGRQTAGQID